MRLLNTTCFVSAALLSVLLFGCALPAPEPAQIAGAPLRDLTVLSLVEEGRDYLGRSRFAEAEGSFSKALYLQPQLDNVKVFLAVALEGQGRFGEAIAVYGQVLEREPESVRLLKARARLYFLDGQHEAAVRTYKRAYDVASADVTQVAELPLIARSMSGLLYQLGDEEGALCWSVAALQIAPGRDSVLKHVKLLNSMNMSAQARSVAEDFVRASGQSSDQDVLSQLTMSAIAQGDWDGARRFVKLLPVSGVAAQTQDLRWLKALLTPPSDAQQEPDGEVQLDIALGDAALFDAATLVWPAELQRHAFARLFKHVS